MFWSVVGVLLVVALAWGWRYDRRRRGLSLRTRARDVGGDGLAAAQREQQNQQFHNPI